MKQGNKDGAYDEEKAGSDQIQGSTTKPIPTVRAVSYELLTLRYELDHQAKVIHNF